MACTDPSAIADGRWYDKAAADAAVDFFGRYLCLTEGQGMGQPFRLEPWQAKIVRDVFGWKWPDGSRVYRILYVEVPRKNGKTELAAGFALLLLVGDGEGGAQVYSAATDKDQAKIAFNKATTMVTLSPDLAEVVETFKMSLYCAALAGSFKPMSSVVKSKHGFSPSGLVADELHEWATADLYEVIHKGTGARRQPLEVLITTAGIKGHGFGWEMHEKARRVLEGEEDDPSFYAVIYGADEDDDWQEPAVWAKANPNLGVSVTTRYMEAEARKARASARLENDFRRFHLNQWTEQVTRWLSMKDWKACTRAPDQPNLWRELWAEVAGRPAWGGLDLGSVSDMTSVAYYVPPAVADGRGVLLWRFWLPEGAVERVPEVRKQLYRGWIEAGALQITPGNATDYAFVKEAILEDCGRVHLQQLGFDRWGATQTAIELASEGLPMAQMGQGYATLGAPTKELERLVLLGRLEHGNNPVARWQVGNAVVRTDPAGNMKPDKERAGDKIDGVVAAVMAIGGAMATEPEVEQTYQRGECVL